MSNLLDTFRDNTNGQISQLVDNPFSKSCIERISLVARRSLFDHEKIIIEGSIEFKNNNTSGEHKLEAGTLPELLLKVYDFCNKLP